MNHRIPAWVDAPPVFTDELAIQKRLIESAPFIGPGATLEKGLDYLAGIADYSIRLAVSDDPLRPHLVRTSGVVSTDDPSSPNAVFRRNGLDNPDNDYLICSLDADHEYEITGLRGTSREVNFQLLDGNYSDRADSFAMNKGILPSRDIDVAPDGKFQMRLSHRVDTSGNSMHMPDGTRALIVRQTYSNWANEAPGPIRIRRVGDDAPDSFRADDYFWERAITYLRNTISLWLQFGPGVDAVVAAAAGPKSLPFNTSRPPRSTPGGFPDQYSLSGRFLVDHDEAVVITMSSHSAAYHSIQLGDYWFTSLPYVHQQSSLNGSQYVVEPSGNVTAIISMSDPGVANWLDTCGLSEGYFFIRWQGLPEGVIPEEPVIAKVRLDDLDRTSAVRSDSITERVQAFTRREQAVRRADWSPIG